MFVEYVRLWIDFLPRLSLSLVFRGTALNFLYGTSDGPYMYNILSITLRRIYWSSEVLFARTEGGKSLSSEVFRSENARGINLEKTFIIFKVNPRGREALKSLLIDRFSAFSPSPWRLQVNIIAGF